jgi:hypothetical protein
MIIGKNWKIESDELNITVFERTIAKTGKKAGEEIWKPRYYFSHLDNALIQVVETEVKRGGMKDLQTVINKMDEVKAEIHQALATS